MDMTACGRADLQEIDGENLTALRFEGITSTLPLRFGRGAAQSDINGNEVAAGTVRSRSSPYGEYRVTPTAGLTDKGFTGHAQNDEVALIYMRARYYVPGIGRFISPDTIIPNLTNLQDINRYGYARNNPLKYRDFSGHCLWDGCLLEIALIGAGIGLIVDYSTQVVENHQAGMDWSQAVFHQNIDKGELAGSTVAGGVSALTAGGLTALAGTGLAGTFLGGFLGGAIGGQTGAFVEATWDEAGATLSSGAFDGHRYLSELRDSGFLNIDTIMIDGAAGIVAGILGDIVGRSFRSAYQTIMRQSLSSQALPTIKMLPGGDAYIELDMSGILLNQTAIQRILQALANGGYDLLTPIFEEIIENQTGDFLETELP